MIMVENSKQLKCYMGLLRISSKNIGSSHIFVGENHMHESQMSAVQADF